MVVRCNYVRSEDCNDCESRFVCWTQQVELRTLPKYGELMTLEDFVQACKEGSFIDYDGVGDYATEWGCSDTSIVPTDVMMGDIDWHWTHVMWFNR